MRFAPEYVYMISEAKMPRNVFFVNDLKNQTRPRKYRLKSSIRVLLFTLFEKNPLSITRDISKSYQESTVFRKQRAKFTKG